LSLFTVSAGTSNQIAEEPRPFSQASPEWSLDISC
jgi:hypothetical protein